MLLDSDLPICPVRPLFWAKIYAFFSQKLRGQGHHRLGPSCSHHAWRVLSPEGVDQRVLTGVRVALGNERHRHSQPSPFQHQVLCREACVLSVHAKGEGQVLTVTQNLVAQELAWKGKKTLVRGQNGKGTSSTESLTFRITYVVQQNTWGSSCPR